MSIRTALLLLLLLTAWNALIIKAERTNRTETILNLTWFECGLLYRYGIDNFMAVLDDFGFDGVMIQPFMLRENSTRVDATAQTGVCIGFHSLCNRVDAYATEHTGFLKFLFVGGSSFIDKGLVEQYVPRGYVMCVDDGTTNLTTLQTVLTYLKNRGAQTLLVHGSHQSYKTVIEQGLVDFSCPCFYPFWPNRNYAHYAREFETIRSWSRGRCKFLAAIQVFGGTSWIFPNTRQIEEMKRFLHSLNPFGLVWFLPHSGWSLRGEVFDGFLSHSEVWNHMTLT